VCHKCYPVARGREKSEENWASGEKQTFYRTLTGLEGIKADDDIPGGYGYGESH